MREGGVTPIRLGVLPSLVLVGVRSVLGSGWTVPGAVGGATRSTGLACRGARRRCAGVLVMKPR